MVDHHFKPYGLARKFRAEASGKIAEFYVTIKGISRRNRKFPDQDIVNDMITEKVQDLQMRGEGANHWEVVLWNAILAFGGFIQFLEDKLRHEGIID